MAEAAKKETSNIYILVTGSHMKPADESGMPQEMAIGEAIALSPAQAEAFKDRFKPKSVVDAEASVAKAAADEAAKAEAAKVAAAGTKTPA